MKRVRIVATAAVCVGLLAGCAAATSDTPGLTASPTTAASATPTPTPTPTGIVETSDTALGIVFEDVPELSGDEAAVYNWIAVYEKEFWRTMTTNEVSPASAILASAGVQATMQRIAAENVATQSVIGGTFRARIDRVTVEGDTARGSICEDYRETELSDVNGPTTPEAIGWDTPMWENVTLQRVPAEDRWMVVASEVDGAC